MPTLSDDAPATSASAELKEQYAELPGAHRGDRRVRDGVRRVTRRSRHARRRGRPEAAAARARACSSSTSSSIRRGRSADARRPMVASDCQNARARRAGGRHDCAGSRSTAPSEARRRGRRSTTARTGCSCWITPTSRWSTRDGQAPWELERSSRLPDAHDWASASSAFTFDPQGGQLLRRPHAATTSASRWRSSSTRRSSAPRPSHAASTAAADHRRRRRAASRSRELDYLVSTLNAGSLPAQLADEPISERTVGPQLGADNLRRGLDRLRLRPGRRRGLPDRLLLPVRRGRDDRGAAEHGAHPRRDGACSTRRSRCPASPASC